MKADLPRAPRRRPAIRASACPSRSRRSRRSRSRQEERDAAYQAGWDSGNLVGMLLAFNDLLTNKEANDTACEFIRNKIRSIVKDPQTAEDLCPFDHPMGTKRPCLDTGYYETYNRDNVTLVNLRRDADRGDHADRDPHDASEEFDVRRHRLRHRLRRHDRRAGRRRHPRAATASTLQDKWTDGTRTYLGLMVHGFPNLFTITGPASPSVFSNMMISIEQHVDWIGDCHGPPARPTARPPSRPPRRPRTAGSSTTLEAGDATLYPLANSWYMGSNVPGKPRVLMPYIGGVGVYRAGVRRDRRRRLPRLHDARRPPDRRRLRADRTRLCVTAHVVDDVCGDTERASVGEAGFEPATSCSQSRCATRLRHSPDGAEVYGVSRPGPPPWPHGERRGRSGRCCAGRGRRARCRRGSGRGSAAS